MDVSIVIPTFRRPAQLETAVRSVFGQVGCDGIEVEIVVVDNDPAGSAREAALALAGPFALRYHLEAQPGVSQARNKGLSEATGRFVAFLDDDEIAAPGWLAALLRTQAETEAEIVFGPVFSVDAPDASTAAFHTCTVDAASGTRVGSSVLTPFWKRDPALAYPRLCSGNVLMDRATLVRTGARFDTTLGRTGGEDTLFFNQLHADGATMVWCAEASVSEPLPRERTGLDYLTRRAFRGGQITSLVPARLRNARLGATLLSMSIGAAQFAVYAPLAGFQHFTGSPRHRDSRLRAAAAAGKIFWGSRFRAKAYG